MHPVKHDLMKNRPKTNLFTLIKIGPFSQNHHFDRKVLCSRSIEAPIQVIIAFLIVNNIQQVMSQFNRFILEMDITNVDSQFDCFHC